MRERFYTTAELARICGVSISTIKRWTDSGLLRCVRTPGGHRKFRLQDVAEAARRLDASMALPDERPAASLDALSLLLLQRDLETVVTKITATLERGDEAELGGWLAALHRHGTSVDVLAGEILLGALTALRARTQDDFIRCRATRVAEAGARYLSAQLPPPVAAAPRALLAGLGIPEASLLLVLGGLVLADAGWDRVDLGPAVPLSTIRGGFDAVQPELVVLATADAAGASELPALLHACRMTGAALCLLPGAETPAHALAALAQQARSRPGVAAARPAAAYTRPSDALP